MECIVQLLARAERQSEVLEIFEGQCASGLEIDLFLLKLDGILPQVKGGEKLLQRLHAHG